MTRVKVREATATDIDAIIAMQMRWSEEGITYGYVPDSRQALMARISQYFLVAEGSNQLVGYIYGSVKESSDMAVFADGEQYLEIEDIYVVPEDRSEDCGSQLLKDLIRRAEYQGVGRCLVYSATKDLLRVLKFYEKFGFRSWCVQLYR